MAGFQLSKRALQLITVKGVNETIRGFRVSAYLSYI